MKMVKEEKMLSIEAIAEELGTSLKQIRRYVASGKSGDRPRKP